MGMSFNVVSDNSGAVIEAKDAAVRRAMEAVGTHLDAAAFFEIPLGMT